MRIFIKDYDIFKLKDKIKTLDKYLVNAKTNYEAFSKEGQFFIDSINTYKLVQNDKKPKTIEKYSNNYDIIVDYTTTTKVEVTQIPADILIIYVKNLYYSLDKNSKIKMLIKISNDIEEVNILDFYLEINEEVDLNNIFIKDEINVFLSMLN